jgi:hypothetical protein
MRTQRLDDLSRTDGADAAAIVRAAGGIQAQDMRAAVLGVAIRGEGTQAGTAAIASARERDRTIVRSWCMRGTLHLVPADLLPGLLAVFGPISIARGRRRLAALGLDDDASARGVAIIGDVLAGRAPHTRHEIAAAVGRRIPSLNLRGQAPIHLVRRACLAGVACEVGSRDGQPVYGLRRDWFPDPAPAPQRSDALGDLGRWYIDGFGPASRDDLATWSGLPAADVRQAWDQIDDLVELHPDLWIRGPDPAAPAPPDPATVRLVPAFDSYLLGYRRRDHAVAPEHRMRVHPGGGVIRPTVLVDGFVAGTWTIQRSATKARLVIATFSGVPGVPMSALDAEVARVSAALEVDLTLAMVG